MGRKNFKDPKGSNGESAGVYADGNNTRETDMKTGAGTETNNSSAPAARAQNEQFVPESTDGSNAKPAGSSFNKKKQQTSGSQLKQDIASRVAISDSDFAGVGYTNPTNAALVTLSYSGDSGTLIGTAANTPVMGTTDRSGHSGRYEKKMNEATRKINFAASEQVIEEYTNPAPLGESADKVQGYYGTPKNTSARSQKTTGYHPADPLYQRSLDFITRDEILYINGQYIREDNVDYAIEPVVSSQFNETTGVREDSNYLITAGNYMPRFLNITLTRDANGSSAYVSAADFYNDANDSSYDYSISENGDIVNASSTNMIIDMNKAEIARQRIDHDAGRETQLNWSPLGRAVNQPTQTNWLLSTIESETGATVATCYRFANKALAYQLNKAAKDGQHPVRPMREMLSGYVYDCLSSAEYATEGNFDFNPFSYNDEQAVNARIYGSAATMILLNDSAPKYSNKGDVLVNSKSLRYYVATANNNINQFRLKSEFGQVLNGFDVFSTIDRDYDPLNPVCMTDRIGLMYTIDPHEYASFTREDAYSDRVYVTNAGPYTYAYANRSSNYVVSVEHPLWTGIYNFVEQYADKIYNLLHTSNNATGSVTWKIPLIHSTTTLSLFDYLVCAATPYIQRVRINAMRDVLDYENNFKYPYDLISIKDYNPLNAVNYTFSSIDEPLVCKRMIPSTSVRWIMPEFYWPVLNTDTGNNHYVLPWYFNEHDFVPTIAGSGANSGFEYNVILSNMTMPVIRSGVRLAYLDDLYSMSERDIRLCLDRMTISNITVTSDGDASPYHVYKYSQASDGIPVLHGNMTIASYLSTPRELGWIIDAPNGVLRNADNLISTSTDDASIAYAIWNRVLPSSYSYLSDGTSFRAYAYRGSADPADNILEAASVNIDRAQAFSQVWDCSPAAPMSRYGQTDTTYVTRPNLGFLMGITDIFANGSEDDEFTAINGLSSFSPFTTGLTAGGSQYGLQVQDADFSVMGLCKVFWTKIQKLPFIISPWDTCDYRITSSSVDMQYDPYDYAAMFGLAGMMASDYTQDQYNRAEYIQTQGWLYVQDPWVNDSPVFRDAKKYTM